MTISIKQLRTTAAAAKRRNDRQHRLESERHEREREARQIDFSDTYRGQWRAACERQMQAAAEHGLNFTRRVELSWDPHTDESYSFAIWLARELRDYYSAEGFTAKIDTFHLPGDHEGPGIYSVALRFEW